MQVVIIVIQIVSANYKIFNKVNQKIQVSYNIHHMASILIYDFLSNEDNIFLTGTDVRGSGFLIYKLNW